MIVTRTRKLFSIALTLIMIIGMFPITALADFPDLIFTMEPGSAVSRAKLSIHGEDYDNMNNTLKITYDSDPSTYSYNKDMNGVGVAATDGYEFPVALRIGSYINLYEIDGGSFLVNRGSIQISNSHLLPPTPGSTVISGGAGKVSVSEYQAVADCKLFLVPDSLYPSPDGAIAITDPSIKEITANGDIVCNAGKYWFYTVYIGSYTGANHGSYDMGSEVTVAAASANICEIAGIGYPTLEAALAAVADGQTITLLSSVTTDKPITISDKNITFALGAYDLIVDTSQTGSSIALVVEGNYTVTCTGTGAFNVIGENGGVQAAGGANVTVTNAEATKGKGAIAVFGGVIQVLGDAKGTSQGAWANGAGSMVTVSGTALATGLGGNAVEADGGGHIDANHVQATGEGGKGAFASSNASIEISGNVSATGSDSVGVFVDGAGTTTTITVAGNATAINTGALAVGGTIVIEGNVTSDNLGVHATDGGMVKIDGELDANPYIKVGTTTKTASDNELQSSEPGYYEYTGGASTVWVKETAVVVLPTVMTNPVTGLTFSTVSLSGNVLSDGGESVDEIGYVCSTSPNPVIGGPGVSRMTLSNPGMGAFNISISGLVASTTYYVRAYAHNSVGWGYGSDVSFTTLPAATVPAAPQNLTATPGNGQVALNWAAPASNGGSAIIRYEVSSNSGSTWVTASSNTAHTFTGLTNGTAYTFKVRAINSAGNGAEASATAMPSSGGSTGNGSSGGGGSYTQSQSFTIVVESAPNMPTSALVTLTNKPDGNGLLAETITDQMVMDAFNKAEAEAKRLSRQSFGISIGFTNGVPGVKSLSVKIDEAAIIRLKTAGVEFCEINTGVFRIRLDKAAISELSFQAKGTITFVAAPVSKLSDSAKVAIGSRPVFDFTVKDGTGKIIISYGKGSITRCIKYTAAGGEKTDNLYVVKIVDGKVQWITESSYDNGWIIWSGDSNSIYGVGYKTPAPTFTDTEGHWAENNIDFVASRGLFSGTSAATFSPDTSITRGMFVTALGRLSGQDVSGYTQSSFIDVAAGSYYLSYIEWAVEHKIVSGIGNSQFAPDKVITREEMAVMIYNYAVATKYTLPLSSTSVTFTDYAQISTWAMDAVEALQQAGVVSGVGDGKFSPKGTATRAEAATILRNFVEGIIDESTARGWETNEAGQWMYWTWDGKLATGWIITTTGARYYMDDNGIMVSDKWLQIAGKWYYFDADGKLATDTTIDGYEVGADGARK